MNREALQVGAFTWSRIQRLYDADPSVHWQRCDAEGLGCPQEVFTQLFHEDARNPHFAAIVSGIDWGRVHWELKELSGSALRQVRVDRGYQHALDEARDRATRFGIVDEREEVIAHWRDAHSWFAPPVLVTGDLFGTSVGDQLLVGFTRLGNLLGLLDRKEVTEIHKHLVWVGQRLSNRPEMDSRQPTDDEIAGMQWWNSMTEPERAKALESAGWKSGGTWTPSAADAWTEHKKRIGPKERRIAVGDLAKDADAYFDTFGGDSTET